MGLLDVLRGVTDQFDAIPGFDPDKNSRGMLSQLLGMNKPQTNPSGVPPIMPPGQLSAPGGANPFQKYSKPRGAIARMLTPNSYDRQYDAGHQNFLAEQGKRFDARQAQMASQQQEMAQFERLNNLADQMDLRGSTRGRFMASPEEFMKHQNVNASDSLMYGGGVIGTAPAKPADPLDERKVAAQELTAQAAMHRAQNPSSMVSVHTGDGTPGNRPIVNKPPPGFQRIWDADNLTYRDIPIPGSEAARAAQAAADKSTSRNDPTTIDALIGSYATLNKNKAIRSQQNSAGENFGAMYSKTPVGRFQDALGGDLGNADNDTARDNIEGISMNMLMKMISMSDVSARAMDSDAEMKAWLGAIKGDQYESALTKLHVLDVSFGSGQALQRAYDSGQIDLAAYEYVTQRAGSDPMAIEMANRMQRYAALEGSVGSENLTAPEAAELQELRAWKASQNAG